MPVNNCRFLQLVLRHIKFFIKLRKDSFRFSSDTKGYREYLEPEEIDRIYSDKTKEINDARDERLIVIACYAGWRSLEINQYLRGDSLNCDHEDNIETLRQLLAVSPRLPEKTVLYRAVSFFVLELMVKEMENTGYFLDKGFLSTSLNLAGISNIEDDLMGKVEYVLKLYVPCGVHALYIENIKGMGMQREEYEVILPPDSIIRMIRPPFKEMRYGYWIFECGLEYKT